ncbi:hypothetical protein [Photobacterium halotolerans]|uniref:Uncharacterized protein n=1 Tax=Photobacterium halotolerans TaxID=265726 RepID=A0A7X4W9F2_9GAMM|nr:hypothetical protein [Photobacterium halotolerans]NAW64632.1 hypothetical protein [Photobacterium halotolerans]
MARNQIAIDVPCIAKVEIQRQFGVHFRILILLQQAKGASFFDIKRPNSRLLTQGIRNWRYRASVARDNMEALA